MRRLSAGTLLLVVGLAGSGLADDASELDPLIFGRLSANLNRPWSTPMIPGEPGIFQTPETKKEKLNPVFSSTFNISIGAYRPVIDSELDLKGVNVSRKVNLESELGLADTDTLPRADLVIRLSRRNRIEASYYDLKRSASTTLSREIDIGDEVFEIGLDVDSTFDTEILRVAYGFSFIQDGWHELGFLVGIHFTELTLELDADNGSVEASTDLLAPLPTIGIYGTWAFTKELSLAARFQYFALQFGDYGGEILNANLSFEYTFLRNLGVGVGFEYFGVGIDADQDDFSGRSTYEFYGPWIFLNAHF